MPRIIRDESNIVPIPRSVSVNKGGYVYYNINSMWVLKKDGLGKTSNHDKVAIGIALRTDGKWMEDRRMYANQNYYKLLPMIIEAEAEAGTETGSATPFATQTTTLTKTVYSEYPQRYDCISVGLYTAINALVVKVGLLTILQDIFGSDSACILLDLAMYMISAESAVFQHFPHWARSHALFSDTIWSDSYISQFEKETITLSQINQFKKVWARKILDDGNVYVCYDSTNVNSQAEGVFIVQKGHAKDDPDKNQVNTEYAIRQKDSMPITFNDFPGSLNDMSEASEMIRFFKNLLDVEIDTPDDEGIKSIKEPRISVIMDRGYVSEENIKGFRNVGIGYILILKKNMGITDSILDKYITDVKKPLNYLSETEQFAYTVQDKLFPDDKIDTWFHIIWDANLEVRHRNALMKDIKNKKQHLQKIIERRALQTEDNLRVYKEYFKIQYHEEGELEVPKKGKGMGKKTVAAYVIDSFNENLESIERKDRKCGYLICISDNQMNAYDAIQAISKRDCVEKTFQALKSWMGMDKIGVHYESSIHTKSLIWFISSIIHSLIFTSTESARKKDKKRSTVPAIVDQLEEIRADKDIETSTFQRRYKPTKQQNTYMKLCNITVDDIDQVIDGLKM